MTELPKTQEEFQLWMVEKVGEIHTKQAEILGEVKVTTANHDALKSRVDGIVVDARSAKHWENGKFLVTFAIQSAMHLFKFHN